MDDLASDRPNVNRGTSVFIGCWVLTGLVFLVLLFRYTVKAWSYWFLPKVLKPEQIWGYNDFFYSLGFAFDVANMALLWKSWQWGLGRHVYYLTPIEERNAMMYAFISQPLAVAAAMWSRTGVSIFLYDCLAHNNRRIKWVIITCGVVQILVNLVVILQIILQCGPNPYRLTNRAAYFHYVWDPLPEDGSVKCQAPAIQAIIGYIQGGFNCIFDFVLTYLAAYEIWQIVFRSTSNASGQRMSWNENAKRLNRKIYKQRILQTVLLCGPLLLSAIAAIVQTYYLSALGSRRDFTWDAVPLMLWIKIENASIPISTCGPVLCHFARTILDKRLYSLTNASKPDEKQDRSNSQLSGLTRSDSDNRGFKRLSNKMLSIADSLAGDTPKNSATSLSNDTTRPYNSQIMVRRDFYVRSEAKEDSGVV